MRLNTPITVAGVLRGGGVRALVEEADDEVDVRVIGVAQIGSDKSNIGTGVHLLNYQRVIHADEDPAGMNGWQVDMADLVERVEQVHYRLWSRAR